MVVNDTLNQRLNRTEFMPFAPVVLDFMAEEYFPNYINDVPAADYMTITYDTAKEYHEQLQAVVHVDGTARPQIIDEDTKGGRIITILMLVLTAGASAALGAGRSVLRQQEQDFLTSCPRISAG